ncbi:PREDICTED: uncharacterized protein LOC108355514, partial [Rhagoletis zephyria]|uniref:uncharacterized protein LOC108355514 n=1 Tax=Rhagoletis zephyria TaxID=28612 RepID=UPI0008113943
MSSFINNDQGSIDFKLIALSLDAGTRVWTSKVDLVYRSTQKVSNSLSMATGDEKAGGGANFEDEEGLFENSFLRNEKKKAAAKKRRKMAPTIVANTDTINGKLEMNIAVDPLFHHFSAAFDVGNVNSMLMTNLASDPSGVLLLDSAEMLNFDDAYKQEKQPSKTTTVDLSDFHITLGGSRQRDLESEEYGGGITVCPPMGDFDITNFSFNDRDASIDHLVSGSMTSPMKSTAFPATGGPYDGGQGRPSFEFDIDAPVDDVDVGDDDDYGGDHDGGDGGGHHSGDEDGGGCGAHGKDHHPQANQLYNQLDASLLEASMMDILPANKNEFFNKNFLRQVFRKVPFKQGAGRSLLDGPGLDEKTADGSSAAAEAKKTARPKRTRPTFEENTYAASKDVLEELFKPPTQEVKDSVSVARPTLNRWSINSERKHLKTDYGFETRHLKALFAKPDTYFNDLRELKEQLGGGGATTSGAAGASVDDYGDDDHDFGAGGGGSGGGGSSDYEGDEVGGGGGTGAEDYIYERPLPDFNIDDDYRSQAQSGATGGEPKLNGHVDPLDIDYCRVAKKVNMKQVKRGMWKIIKKSTTTEL